jgi:general secretion pathway protein J
LRTAPVTCEANAESGFTLIEVLVSLALVSLLTLIIVGAIGQMRSISAISKSNEADVELQAFGNYLAQLIAGAKPLALIGDNPDRRIVFAGKAEQLRFSSVVRVGSNQLALRDVEIRTASSNGKLALVEINHVRRVGETYPNADVTVAPITLMNVLKSVHFEYLEGTPASSTTQKWLKDWDMPGKMPRAVRFTIEAERFSRLARVARIVNLRLGL